MSNQMYDTLKFIAQLVIPALATLVIAVCQIWHLPFGTEIGATLMAIDTFLGAILKISSDNYVPELDEEQEEEFSNNRGDDDE